MNYGVHAAHCCKIHGCKYCDDDCPVILGIIDQKYDCEECIEDEKRYKSLNLEDLLAEKSYLEYQLNLLCDEIDRRKEHAFINYSRNKNI